MIKKGTYDTKFGIKVTFNEDTEPFSVYEGIEFYQGITEDGKTIAVKPDMLSEESYGTGYVATGINPVGMDTIAAHGKPLGGGTDFKTNKKNKKKKGGVKQEPKTTVNVLKRGEPT